MKTLTIFTPAYNRAHTITRTYESLLRQTCKDFEWLVVDDGSTDNTQELVEGWINENKIPIKYVRQENQGMHGAHNTAYRNIETELNTCIDSDDFMPDDAVEKIVMFWDKHRTENVAGFVGLDYTIDGELIGDLLPSGKISLWRYLISGGRGDKKLVYRTDVIKQYPDYPIFEGEKYVSLATKYFLIDQDLPLLTINEPLVYVDYQLDGSSYNMYRNYVMNPKGFVFDRKLVLSTRQPLKVKLKYCIHYIANKLLAKECSTIISDSPVKVFTILMLPLGWLWYKIIVHNYNKGKKMSIK